MKGNNLMVTVFASAAPANADTPLAFGCLAFYGSLDIGKEMIESFLFRFK